MECYCCCKYNQMKSSILLLTVLTFSIFCFTLSFMHIISVLSTVFTCFFFSLSSVCSLTMLKQSNIVWCYEHFAFKEEGEWTKLFFLYLLIKCSRTPTPIYLRCFNWRQTKIWSGHGCIATSHSFYVFLLEFIHKGKKKTLITIHLSTRQSFCFFLIYSAHIRYAQTLAL